MAGWVAAGLLAVALLALASMVVRRDRRLRASVDLAARQIASERLPSASGLDEAVRRLGRVVERHKRDDEETATEELRVVAALDALHQGVVLADAKADIVYRNPVAEAFQRARHSEALVAATIEELLERAVHGELVDREIELFGPPHRVLYVVAQPVTAKGRQLGVLALIDDITEHQRIDAIRRDFVANISHELKTPIGALSLLAETLQGESDPETVDALARRIQREADRMSRTVDELLELSRIEHDDAFDTVVDVRDAIATAVDRARVAAEQKSLSLGAVMPDHPLEVVGDLRQLSSAVFNLVDNAVKYTAAGGTIGIRARAAGDMIEVSVHDTGMGIPRRDLDRVFERFYRVDRARSRDSGGIGLGLSIVRHVAANHGGRVEVDSTEGEGSAFTLFLPQVAPADDEPHATGHGDDPPLRTGGWTHSEAGDGEAQRERSS